MPSEISNNELLKLLIEAESDLNRFQALMKQYDKQLTADFARAAGDVWSQAMGRQQHGLAQRAIMVAGLVFLKNGLRAEAIRAQFEFTQFQFLAANTPDEYRDARKALGEIAARAMQVGAAATAFMAHTRSAECCFFALDGEPDFYKQQDWIRVGTSDLVEAASVMPANAEQELPNFFGTFVSVLCALYTMSRERVWTDPEMTTDWWRKLAAAVERNVPIAYELPASRPEAGQHNTRRTLAELSESHGNPEIALKRLELGLQR